MKIKSPGDITFDLPEIYQYDDYHYARECCCPECSRSPKYRYGDWLNNNTKGIVGYCVQKDGSYCICLVCPVCGEKYRYHYCERWIREGDRVLFNVDDWKENVALAMELENDKTGEYEDLIIKREE